MCNRKGRRRRELDAIAEGRMHAIGDIDGLEGYCPPIKDLYLGPTPYLLRGKGVGRIKHDGLGGVSLSYTPEQVFNPPIPIIPGG